MATAPETAANLITGYVALLPIFKGDGSPPAINDFFILFEEIADLAQWNSSQKLILAKSRCRDVALQFLLDSEDVKSIIEFADFKSIMMEHFKQSTNRTKDAGVSCMHSTVVGVYTAICDAD